MTYQISFLKVKVNALTAAMTLGVLFLLPSTNLGFGTTIAEEAFGQLDLSIPDGGQEQDGGEEGLQATSPSMTSTFLLRGIIATSLPAQGADSPNENVSSSNYILAGRWRIFVDEGLVNRFIAEMNLAATNGTVFHNMTIEDTTPHRFALRQSGNETAATTTSIGSVPPVSADILTRISIDNNTPTIDNVPVTISVRGQVLTIEGIDIDETAIADTGQRDILSIIDGQTIFGVVPR
ncbi:MAG: hypothetical protein M3261_03545 [Thermoproteota archaeon]|nr:hypothetical protein [Thermoproteota archaeon]